MQNKFSIIVLTYNSGEYIKKTIESILPNMIDGDELIIIDNNSSDDTISKIQEISIENCSIYKLSKNIGISAGRNLGASLAKHSKLAFIDSDMILEKTSLQNARIKINECDALIGEYYDEGNGLNWQIEMTRELFAKKRKENFDGPITFKKFATFSGGMCVIDKDVFLKAGGYSEKYFGSPCEDINFEFELLKQKRKLLIDKSFVGHHKKKKLTLWGLIKRGIHSGKGVALLIRSSFKHKVIVPFNLQWPRFPLYILLFIILLSIFKPWSLITLAVLTILRWLTIIFSIKKRYSLIRLINFEVLRFIYEFVLLFSLFYHSIFYWPKTENAISNYKIIEVKNGRKS